MASKNIGKILSVVVALAATTGCAPYEPMGPRAKPEKPTGESNNSPQNTAPNPTTKPRSEPDGGKPAPMAPIKISILIKSKDPGHYTTLVRPSLEKSCVVDGCHHQPEFIDLTKFPFSAQGSFIMERIKRELGENPPEGEVQKMIVEELISTMETQYMPPATHPPAEDGEIKHYRDWLATGLEMDPPLFVGKFVVSGQDKGEVLCHQSWDLEGNEISVNMERTPCMGATEVGYQVIAPSQEVVLAGEIDSEKFFNQDKWRAELAFD